MTIAHQVMPIAAQKATLWGRVRQWLQTRRERREKAAIAKAFNDRYTFRKEWMPMQDRLPGTAMGGATPRAGYAWMCPECNRIHHPTESSVFSGLQYPACCHTGQGHRLSHGIKY